LPDLYSEILLDHFRLPRHKGHLEHPTITVEGVNPLCGDELSFDLEFENEQLKNISFTGKGCAISMASASMMAEILYGKSIEEIETWIENFKAFIREGEPPDGVEMGDIDALAGISKLPVRVKCATLPWTTIAEGLKRFRGQ
jgi:nitrogen fixation protein NifU and related proteins